VLVCRSLPRVRTVVGTRVQALEGMLSRRHVVIWMLVGVASTLLVLLAISPWDLEIALALADSRGTSFGELIQRCGRKPATVLILVSAFLLAFPSQRMARPRLARAAAALCAHMLLQPALLTNTLKLFVGRTRPVRLGPAGEGFTPFFIVSPGLGDFSFPSGHVAVAMIVAPCVLLLWRDGHRAGALGLALFEAAWAMTVAWGRIVHGAHFVTDVVFSMGLGVALAPLSVHLGDRALRYVTRRDGEAGPRPGRRAP